MTVWLYRLILTAMSIVVLVLTISAMPNLLDRELSGTPLLVHMMASGAMVVLLPVLSVISLLRFSDASDCSRWLSLALWCTIGFGFVSTTMVFVCMLPIAPTSLMHKLIDWHGVLGFAMSVALVITLVIGFRQTSQRTD